MVLLTTTPTILSALSSLPTSCLSELSLPSTLSTEPPSTIDHKTLIAISRLTRSSPSKLSLDVLLRGTSIYRAPPPTRPPPSAEYLALKARLLREQEQREYDALIHKPSEESSLRFIDSEDNDPISPSLVLNILLSIVLCAGAVFHVTRFWYNDGLRVLASLGAGIIVGIAEAVVYAAYLRKVERSRQKERAKREIKTLIVDDEKGEAGRQSVILNTSIESEKDSELVWGRGINGGMRRRVREKWEKEQEREESDQIAA